MLGVNYIVSDNCEVLKWSSEFDWQNAWTSVESPEFLIPWHLTLNISKHYVSEETKVSTHNTKFWGKEGYLSLLKDVPKTGDLDMRVMGWETAQTTKSDHVFPTKQSLKSLNQLWTHVSL